MTEKKQKPKTKHRGPWLKNPKLPREGEEIGAGYFVFRRGDGTNRVRPSMWPFEHAIFDSAVAEAQKLAAKHPGYVFEVFGRVERASVKADENQAA